MSRPSPAVPRHTIGALIALLAVLALTALAGLATAPATAGAADRSFAPVSVKAHAAGRRAVVTYKITKLKSHKIRKARVKASGRRQRVSLRRARAAARRGLLKVRLQPQIVRVFRKTRSAPPKLVVTLSDGTVHVAKPVSPKPAVTPVAEPKPPAAPVATGACEFGTFGVGNWPGACWRPYSNDSPFNKKLPANPRTVANSDAIIGRLTGFGPLQHMTAGQSGTEMDYGDPVYWSKPTDPEYTIHCVENWGTCSIEGHRIRIPREAEAAKGEDGHMTVIDQRTGWEYDFWATRGKTEANGGRIDIGWGGRLRIDGNGLGDGGTAAEFGSLAGKIRPEEMEAGRIDHALFIAARCSNGTTVWPAVGHEGQSCASIGKSNENAPPMGSHIVLDMTVAEINALNMPEWKKTILRALSEYGAFMGDTGSDWAITETSTVSETVFGYEDKWVKFAKKNNVPFYEPAGVHVFNLREGIDWRSRLKVVDPCVSKGTC